MLHNPIPTISAEEAADFAKKSVYKKVKGNKFSLNISELIVKKNSLFVFQKGLIQGYNEAKHLVYEIEITNNNDIREFIYVDAHNKFVVEQFTGVHTAGLNRELYETSLTPANLKWKEGDPLPGTLDQWQESEVLTAGHTYNLMKNAFGFVSYDNNDAKMITINNKTG